MIYKLFVNLHVVFDIHLIRIIRIALQVSIIVHYVLPVRL